MVETALLAQMQKAQTGYGLGKRQVAAGRWAQQLFEKKYKEARWSQLWSWWSQKRTHLINLHPSSPVQQKGGTQREWVSLEQIIGSCGGRANDFDSRFRPRHRHNQERWQQVAMAFYQKKNLPPVELVKVDDVFYVQDGHHRLSVAASMGRELIEANVTEWVLSRPV